MARTPRKQSTRKKSAGSTPLTPHEKRLRAYQRQHPNWRQDPNWKSKARGHKEPEGEYRRRLERAEAKEAEGTGIWTPGHRATVDKFMVRQAGTDQHISDPEEEWRSLRAEFFRTASWQQFQEIRALQEQLAREHLAAGQPKKPEKRRRKKTRRGTVTVGGGPDKRIVGSLGQLEKIGRTVSDSVQPWMLFYHRKRRR